MSEIERYTGESSLELAPRAWSLANKVARTDFVPKDMRGKPEAVLACILTGHEAGVTPMQALQKIYIVNGKAGMESELMRALVQRAGHEIWIEETSSERCTVAARRTDDPEGRTLRITWTMDDARRAGLVGKDVWKKYPADMLLARATSRICRILFPDVLAGLSHTKEELIEDALDAEPVTVDHSPEPPRAAQEPQEGIRASHVATSSPTAGTGESEPDPDESEGSTGELPPLPGEEDIVDAEIVDTTIPDDPDPDEFPEPGTHPADEDGPRLSGPQQIAIALKRLGIEDPPGRLKAVRAILNRGDDLVKSNQLSSEEISTVLETLRDLPDGTQLITPEELEPKPDPEPQTEDDSGSPATWDADKWRSFLKSRKVKATELLREAHSLGAKVGSLDEIPGSGIEAELVGFVEDLAGERGK